MRRAIMALSVLTLIAGDALAAEDTPKAAATRKLLKEKVSVEYKNEQLANIADDLKEQVKGLVVLLDGKGGVSKNRKFTLKAKDKTVEDLLDEMFKDQGLGYYVISEKGGAYDGAVMIVVGKARGYKEGEEPKPEK